MPPDDPGEFDDADLPGLDDDSPSTEPTAPDAADNVDTSLGDGISIDFREPVVQTPTDRGDPRDDSDAGDGQDLDGDADLPGLRADDVSEGGTLQFDYDPPVVIDELQISDIDAVERTPARWVYLGGGFGILGLVLAVGFFLRSGDANDTKVAVPPETPAESTAPPSTEATVIDTAAPAVAGVSAVPFPTSWAYTATKTASIVPAPEFMTPIPVGAVLPGVFNVTESCQQEVCTYVTEIDLLMPDPLFPAPPETTWDVNDTGWSLDVTYLSMQSAYDDGTICAIRNHDTFELTVTNEGSIPTAFTGTWVQATSADLGASSGNIDLYCEPWEIVDEWSLVGVTG